MTALWTIDYSGHCMAVLNLLLFHFPPSMHNLQLPVAQDKQNSDHLDSQLQEQERIITISYALASEASQRSKEVAGIAQLFTNHWLEQYLLLSLLLQKSKILCSFWIAVHDILH